MKLNLTISTLFSIVLCFSAHASTRATAGDKVEGEAKAAVKDVKHAARKVADKGCEWIHGKLECAGKTVQHKIDNAKDDLKD